jgi:hypothetical protein
MSIITLTSLPLYPEADSRQLPPRIDFTETVYLRLVGSSNSIGRINLQRRCYGGRDRASHSQPGRIGNVLHLMLHKALFGCLSIPPAPLEGIIDTTVKTGAALSQVALYNYANLGTP